MKEYILKPFMTPATLTSTAPAHKPALPPRQPLPRPVFDPARPSLKLGLDVHLEFIMAVAQRDYASPQAPRTFTPEQLIQQIKKWSAEGLQIFTVQESCGFGFTLHRDLAAAGAQSFLITLIALNGQRKTDKLDARALCLRLSRWVEGNHEELSPIRIPSEREQRQRESSRRRQFLTKAVRMLANRGHGQVAEYAHLKLPHRWWGARNWKKLSTLDSWLLGVLEKLKEVIVILEAQLQELEKELIARVREKPRPKGLGEISLVTLEGEGCDWGRFHNRKQIGSYTGCCPGEHSSGGKRRVGAIDRMGNGRVRTILVEAVRRFLKWQPGWKAALKIKGKLGSGTAMKKKTVIAWRGNWRWIYGGGEPAAAHWRNWAGWRRKKNRAQRGLLYFSAGKLFQKQSVREHLRSGESSPQLQLVNRLFTRGLEGADSPVAASHKHDTGALGFDSTVRIGAGAGRTPDTPKAAAPIGKLTR